MKSRICSGLAGIVIIAAILLSASCGDADEGVPASTETITQAVEETTAGIPQPDLPAADFEGFAFRIMARGEGHEKWTAIDIVSDGPNGEPINDAVYERNLRIEERFNAVVTNVDVMNPAANMKKLILAGDDGAELVTDALREVAALQTAKYLVDFAELGHIGFEMPWWDQNLIHGLSVMNRIYMMTGDISVMDNAGTWVIAFNKDMAAKYNLDSPYDAVTSGRWTYDKMYDMMKPIPADLDGNGQMDDFDQWAYVGEPYNTYALLVGSGARITSKDDDDLPVLSIYSEDNMLALEKVFDIMLDQTTSLLSNTVKGSYSHVFNECIVPNFGEGLSLFYMGSMKVIELLRSYDVNFGILPAPKLRESQEHYYGSYSIYNCNVYAVPITNTDLSRTGILTEALAAFSMDTLTPAYYDITLKGKSLRDTDSEAMLDLLFASRLYDLGAVFEWGGFSATFQSMTTSKTRDFASKYAAAEVTAQAAIDKFIDALREE